MQENLLARRLIAKKQKDWQLADQIRQELNDMEIEIEDKTLILRKICIYCSPTIFVHILLH